MPTYSYRCTECGNAFDIHQAFSDDALTTCDACGGRLRKLFNTIGVTFNGYPLSTSAGPFARVLGPGGSSPCWSAGGGTGTGNEKLTFTYRADVLRFLPIGANGEVAANGTFQVQVPDGGSGNSTPIALGATLLIVYRDTSKPLTAIVIYDGNSTINNQNQTQATAAAAAK